MTRADFYLRQMTLVVVRKQHLTENKNEENNEGRESRANLKNTWEIKVVRMMTVKINLDGNLCDFP